MQLSLHDEISIDGFCGGGGWSTGFELATGEPVTIGINHDAAAIVMHRKNHPYTTHYNESIWDVDPRQAVAGRPVGWAHFSPDCKHFSRAKGAKPVSKKIRGLAWVAIKWAGTVKPRIISIENVSEFMTWGGLKAARGKHGRVMKRSGGEAAKGEYVPYRDQILIPDKKKAGRTFCKFVRELERMGYTVKWAELRACDYGAPTSRKRFFLIARRDGKPIIFPAPTHGDPKSAAVKNGELLPWGVAADIIDWSIECPSIFDRKKPLAENTMKRIARGLQKFVIDNPNPFIVQVNHSGKEFRGQGIDQPLSTLTGKNGIGVVTPIIASIGQMDSPNRAGGMTEPLRTVVSKEEHCLVTGSIIQYHSEKSAGEHRGQDVCTPLQTVDTSNRYGMMAATLIQTGYGEREGQAPRAPGLDKPLGTVVGSGKHAAVTAFLSKYYKVNGGKADREDILGCGGGYTGAGSAADQPVDTVTAIDHNSVVTANIIQLNNHCIGQAMDEPLRTVAAGGGHFSEVRALLIKFYGSNGKDNSQPLDRPMDTVMSKDKFGLVTIAGVDYQIVDIGLRMLSPRELYRAHAFPEDYIIEFDFGGKPLSKAEQVCKVGNSVPPAFATAIVRANWAERCKRSYSSMAQLQKGWAV